MCSSVCETLPTTCCRVVSREWSVHERKLHCDPPLFQEDIHNKIHVGHQGISKCRDKARQSVWWPGLSAELERLVGNCRTCCIHQQQRAELLIPSELYKPTMGQTCLNGRTRAIYSLTISHTTMYIELVLLSQPTAQEVIKHTKSIFARHGIPEEVISDNSPQYSSEVYTHVRNSFLIIGLAVLTSPKAMEKWRESSWDSERMLKKSSDPYLAILVYRTTLIQEGTCKYSSAELLMNWVLRSTVPTTREQRASKVPDPTDVRVRDMNVKV